MKKLKTFENYQKTSLLWVPPEPVHKKAAYFRVRVVGTELAERSDPLMTFGWTTVGDCKSDYLDDASTQLRDWKCAQCPQGASCDGDIRRSDVVALKGWWRASAKSLSFTRCYIANACKGLGELEVELNKYNTSGAAEINSLAVEACNEAQGYRERCKDYHTGYEVKCRLCASCVRGYRRGKLRGECEKCYPSATRMILWPVGIFLFCFVVAALVILSVRAYGGASDVIKKVFLNFVQLVSLAAELRGILWPSALGWMFYFLDTFSLSLGLFNPECDFSYANIPDAERFYLRYIIFSFVPIAIVGVVFFVWCCVAPCLRKMLRMSSIMRLTRGHQLQDCLIRSSLLLLFVIYPSTVSDTLKMLICEQIDGVSYLAADFQERCFIGRHSMFMLAVFVPRLLLYIMGLPVAALLTLRRNRSKLDNNARVKFRYDFLYNGYKVRRYWWEGVVVLRKVGMAILSSAPLLESRQQIRIAQVFVMFFLVLHLSFMPFRTSKEFIVAHRLECFSLAATFFTYWAAIWFSQGSSGVGIDVIVFATLFINAGFILYTFRIYCQKYKSTVTNHRLTKIAARKASQIVQRRKSRVETEFEPRMNSIEQRVGALERNVSTISHAFPVSKINTVNESFRTVEEDKEASPSSLPSSSTLHGNKIDCVEEVAAVSRENKKE